MKTTKQPATNTGHRQRLRARFLQDNGLSMPDYEILELILFGALPRGDTKALAKALLKEFKSYANVLNASAGELQRVSGMGDAAIAAIKLAHSASLRLLKENITETHVIANWSHLIDYCRVAMGHMKVEQLRLLLLNTKHRLIADEVLHVGTINHTPFYPREVIKRALELSAASIIIVHNHPSGDPRPSEEDIIATRTLQTACKNLEINLHDHVVFGADLYFSFRAKGMLD